MKTITIILCLLSINAMAGEYDMRCERVYNSFDINQYRCENSEVICYSPHVARGSGQWCFKK